MAYFTIGGHICKTVDEHGAFDTNDIFPKKQLQEALSANAITAFPPGKEKKATAVAPQLLDLSSGISQMLCSKKSKKAIVEIDAELPETATSSTALLRGPIGDPNDSLFRDTELSRRGVAAQFDLVLPQGLNATVQRPAVVDSEVLPRKDSGFKMFRKRIERVYRHVHEDVVDSAAMLQAGGKTGEATSLLSFAHVDHMRDCNRRKRLRILEKEAQTRLNRSNTSSRRTSRASSVSSHSSAVSLEDVPLLEFQRRRLEQEKPKGELRADVIATAAQRQLCLHHGAESLQVHPQSLNVRAGQPGDGRLVDALGAPVVMPLAGTARPIFAQHSRVAEAVSHFVEGSNLGEGAVHVVPKQRKESHHAGYAAFLRMFEEFLPSDFEGIEEGSHLALEIQMLLRVGGAISRADRLRRVQRVYAALDPAMRTNLRRKAVAMEGGADEATPTPSNTQSRTSSVSRTSTAVSKKTSVSVSKQRAPSGTHPGCEQFAAALATRGAPLPDKVVDDWSRHCTTHAVVVLPIHMTCDAINPLPEKGSREAMKLKERLGISPLAGLIIAPIRVGGSPEPLSWLLFAYHVGTNSVAVFDPMHSSGNTESRQRDLAARCKRFGELVTQLGLRDCGSSAGGRRKRKASAPVELKFQHSPENQVDPQNVDESGPTALRRVALLAGHRQVMNLTRKQLATALYGHPLGSGMETLFNRTAN